MCRLKIVNLSTLTDVSAMFRLASYLANDLQAALNDSTGNQIINITKKTYSFGYDEYVISDIEE